MSCIKFAACKKTLLNKKIRVGAVNYLNTKPLIYGFEQGEMLEEIDLVLEYPSKIAAMLANDEIDVGLVPVAIIPQLKEHYIISDYCIGCDGEVGSVCLFSEVPLEKIERILLDYQSTTSIGLLKILIKEFWKINPIIQATSKDYIKEIKNTTAGLIIGDRALQQRTKSKYLFDLGKAWKDHTGLSFVFAAWISNKELQPEFIKAFNEANKSGLLQLEQVIRKNPYKLFNLKDYYTHYVNYHLDKNAKNGLQYFLSKL